MLIIKNNNSFLLTIFLLLNFVYIFKQTNLSLYLNINYYYLLTPLIFILLIFFIIFYLKKINLKRYSLFFFLLFLCFFINFFIFEKFYFLSFFVKLLLLLLVLVYLINLKKNQKKIFWLSFSKSTLFSVFFIIIITDLFFINQNSPFVVNNLIKKSGGFINPNIGPFFLLSSLIIFYIYKDVRYFLLTILLTILLFYIGIYSRLCLAMTLLFFILYFLDEKKLYLIFNFIKKICFVLIFLIFIYLLIGIFSSLINWYIYYNGNLELGIIHGFRLFEGFFCIRYPLFSTYGSHDNNLILYPNGVSNLEYIKLSLIEYLFNVRSTIAYSKIDYYLSHRIYNLFHGFFIPSTKFPFFSINLHDSIYYEVFVRSGFFPLYFLIKSIYSINKAKFNSTFHIRILIVFSSLLFFGFFEGVLFKFSTMAVIIFIFILLEKKALRLF